MTDYISREDALNFELSVEADPAEIQAITKGMSLYAECITSIPAADVAPVVRCRECKFLHLSTFEKWCWNEDSIGYAGRVTNDWYCADGLLEEETGDETD